VGRKSVSSLVLFAVVVLGCGRVEFEPLDADADGSLDADASDAPSDVDAAADTGAPPPVPSIRVTAGGDHSCALVAGEVWCWGANDDGQLGDGTTTDRPSPVRAAGLPAGPVTQVSAGHFHTCAVTSGDAWCWGQGTTGALGDGTGRSSPSPVMVLDLPRGAVTRVSAGRVFTCAVADAQAYCWGSNGSGRLGTGTAAGSADTAQRITDWSTGVSYIFAGGDHAIAIVGGALFTWGHDDEGALGAGMDLGSSDVPVPVAGLDSGATEASMGGLSACALVSGAAWCWGTGGSGELGDGASVSSNTPVMATGMESDVTSLQMGGGPDDGDAPCAVQRRQLSCWGNNGSGRLGDGTTTDRSTPVAVLGLPAPPYAVEGGFFHTCTVLEDDRIFCWGAGARGQLGDGGGSDSLTPVAVTPSWMP